MTGLTFLLDTCVLSDAAKAHPDSSLVRWITAQPQTVLAVSVLTLGELRKGVERLTSVRRRAGLDDWLTTELPRQFAGRILSVDAAVADAWGRLDAAGQREGHPLPVIDGLLLATAAAHGLTFVTRNERDVAGRGVQVLNPWS